MSPRRGTVAAVVLAAGGSRRLGHAKQLVHVDGRSLVARAALAAVDAGCRPVIVVVGARRESVAQEVASLADVGVRRVTCEAWEDGLSASLRCGVAALVTSDAPPAAIVLLPCDQPALEPAVIRALIDAWEGTAEGRVASTYAGTVGSPALFGAAFFPRLLELQGDRGAKTLLEGAPAVDWPAGARDVDEPGDL